LSLLCHVRFIHNCGMPGPVTTIHPQHHRRYHLPKTRELSQGASLLAPMFRAVQ